MNEEEPFVDRVVASGSLKKGLQPRATPQRWHRDVQRLIDLVAFLCFFDNRKHVFLSTVASTTTPSAYALGCGRRVAIALWGDGTQRGFDAECDASEIFALASAGR